MLGKKSIITATVNGEKNNIKLLKRQCLYFETTVEHSTYYIE